MNNQNEYEKRYRAIQLYKERYGFNKILQLVQRSKGWLSKWPRRSKEQGLKGLKDKSRTPKRIWRETPERMVKKILSIRKGLESHKTRRSAFSGIGAEAIHWELKQREVRNVPSISTIAKILSRQGKIRRAKTKRNSNTQPYPYIKAEKMGDLYQGPKRRLTQKEHGTRFPVILRDHLSKSLRHLPEGFSLDKYMDSNSHLSIPIAKGKVSFIRKVDSYGKIEVNEATYFIKRKLEGRYVIAPLFPYTKRKT